MIPSFNKDCRPVSSSLPPISVPIETLSDGVYTVRSFFGAIHAILCHCIPIKCPLKEYVEFFLLFTRLLNCALSLCLHTSSSAFNPKIALLVCLSSRMSRAIIGFSASGNTREVKQEIIKDRRNHLPDLQKINTHDLPWSVGNCTEAEAFAHLKRMGEAGDRSSQTIAASLTLDLRELSSRGPCLQCSDLFRKVHSEFIVTVSLAPLKGYGIIQQEHNW